MSGLLRTTTFVLAVSLGASAFAQAPPASLPSNTPGGTASSGSSPAVSAIGKRMPKAGTAKSGQLTRLEKLEQDKMDKDMTICKGC